MDPGTFLVVPAFFLVLVSSVGGLRGDDCEVCVAVLSRFIDTVDKQGEDRASLEKAFKTYCRDLKQKENRFCYYVGGTEDAATGILGEVLTPISWGMPADKICEKLKKKDGQICRLRYDKQIDLNSVDLKKLKVRDLKKILGDWDESCEGCLEKGDFIQRIEELKPKYVRRGEL